MHYISQLVVTGRERHPSNDYFHYVTGRDDEVVNQSYNKNTITSGQNVTSIAKNPDHWNKIVKHEGGRK